MGCTVRDKPVRANRRIRPVAVRSDPPASLINRIGLSKSKAESSLKNPVYHPGVTDSGCVNSNPNLEEDNVLGHCTEEHLEEILLKQLEVLYNQTISKLVKLGYDQNVALRAVLSNGHCYGEFDVLTNIFNNSLSYLNSDSSHGNCEDGSDSETGFTDLKDLEDYSLAGMIYLLQQVKPNLSKGDAMWCLLLTELHVGRASALNITIPGDKGSCCSMDDGNVEDVGGGCKELDIAGFMAPALCRFHGGWDFGNRGGPEFAGYGFSMDGGAEVKLQREIVCPKRFNLSPAMKSLLKRNVAAFAAGFRASMKQKEIQSETCGDSVSCKDPARVETNEKPCNEVVSFSSVLEKFRDLNIDDDLESMGEEDKDGVIVNLLHQVKDLEKKLKERKDWAQKKAMQAAQKVSEELTELQSLNSEREGIQLLKKGKQAIEESTVKKLSEMENALRKAHSQIDKANAIARALENQNAEIRAEREGSKLSASESNKACAEATKKEKKCSKKLVAWEKQKLKLQDEITAEKEKIKSLYMAIAQITQNEKETEAKWRQEQIAKEQALAEVEEEQRSKEAAEAHNKRKLETLRLKIELDFQRHKDDHQRLEQELSRLKASSDTDSSHLSNNVWNPEKSQGENIDKLLEELDKLEGSYENEGNNDRECIICMKDEVSVVFLPCAHQVVCGSCSDSFFASNTKGGSKVTCPCCRGLVQQRIRIFGGTS